MTFFGAVSNFLGKPASSNKDGLQTIRDQLANLEKRRDFLEKKIEDQKDAAKKAIQKQQRASASVRQACIREARMCAKRSMDMQKQLETIDSSIMKLDSMISAIESQATSEIVVKSIETGTRVMKTSLRKTSVKEVDDLMLKVAESIEDSQDLSEAIAMSIGPQPDNSDLDDYLASLTAEELEDAPEPAAAAESASTTALTTPTQPKKEPTSVRTAVAEQAKFPSIPSKAPDSEDDELAKLAAEMTI